MTVSRKMRQMADCAARFRAAVLVAFTLSLAACAVGPGHDSLLSQEEEARIGAAAHAEIVSQFGGAYDEPRVNSYVETVTRRLAQAAGERPGSHRVTVLDTATVNAFAAPGGYLYVTRGLLILANDEAELASVMAHEMGHLVARHSTRRQTIASQVNTLSGVLGSLTGSSYLAEALNLGGASYVAAYSRDQEREADEIGIAMATRAGYAPFAASTFLTNLERYFALDRKLSGTPSAFDHGGIMSTHPTTPERIQLARTAAVAAHEHGGPDEVDVTGDRDTRRRAAYLETIDGLPFADNPSHGVVDGRTFSQPVLRFRFQVPEGFELVNRHDAVLARGPEDAVIIFDGAELDPGVSLKEHMIEQWGEGLDLHNPRSFTVNGMAAVASETLHKGFGHELVVIEHGERVVYRFLFITRPKAMARYERAFQSTVQSFKRLSTAQAAAIEALRVRVVTVRAGDTVESLAQRMAFGAHKVEQFRILNGLGPDSTLEPGERVKIVAR